MLRRNYVPIFENHLSNQRKPTCARLIGLFRLTLTHLRHFAISTKYGRNRRGIRRVGDTEILNR